MRKRRSFRKMLGCLNDGGEIALSEYAETQPKRFADRGVSLEMSPHPSNYLRRVVFWAVAALDA